MLTEHDIDMELARAHGLCEVGGDLTPERLLAAYRRGVFPWYDEDTPILWWSPDPRAIFDLERFEPPRRLARTYRSNKFKLTIDQDFSGVIHRCASNRDGGTWITSEMVEAYQRLHALGHAHSVEAWHEGDLVGGLYGVAIGGFFAGESMFHRRRDAGNVALLHAINVLRTRGFILFDTQFLTDHTQRLGAVEITKREYLQRLETALARRVSFSDHART